MLAESPAAARGSGGPSAWARFEREHRSLEFHFRYGLGLVRYAVNGKVADHEAVVWALGGGQPAWPTFEKDPGLQFHALLRDIQSRTRKFFIGTDADAEQIVMRGAERPKGISRLSEKKSERVP